MNFFFHTIVSAAVQKRMKKRKITAATPKQIARETRILRIEYLGGLKEVLLIIIGVLSASFGLRGFLLPNDFIDGGVTGISLLVKVVTDWNLGLLLVVINTPFLLLGIKVISRSFAVKSIIAIALLAITVHYVPFPVVTEDKLLIAVFGGFFLGLGIGLSIRGGAVIDGTEVLAVYLSRQSSLTIGDIILLFNMMIFSVGAYLLSVEVALYAILTYLAASKTVDFVIDGLEEYMGVTIISKYSEEIREAIVSNLGRGCTVFLGRGGKEGKKNPEVQEILYTVITRLELAKLKMEIEKIDDQAFLTMSSIKDTKGGMVKKRPLKK
ncbi:MAG: YitT family protein [Bacteroidia bacterium]|nr:YitT family protein [Bacteroidia bacterium]